MMVLALTLLLPEDMARELAMSPKVTPCRHRVNLDLDFQPPEP